jgi:hypothetical protein
VEYAVLAAIVALWVLGAMVPTGHTVPQEIAGLTRGLRLCLPYSKEDIRIIYRIRAKWRVERVSRNGASLAQHFEVSESAASYYQTRKLM